MQWCDHTWADIWWWPTGDVTSHQSPGACHLHLSLWHHPEALSSVCVKSFELWLSVTCSWCVSDFWAIRTWIWLEWYISTWYFATTRHRQLPSLSPSDKTQAAGVFYPRVLCHWPYTTIITCLLTSTLIYAQLFWQQSPDLIIFQLPSFCGTLCPFFPKCPEPFWGRTVAAGRILGPSKCSQARLGGS